MEKTKQQRQRQQKRRPPANHPTNNNAEPRRPHPDKILPIPNGRNEVKMSLEAAENLLELKTTSEKRPVPTPQTSRNSQRARKSDEKKKHNEKTGNVQLNTRPVIVEGHLEKKRISEGTGFHTYLADNKILKDKYVTFPDQNTKDGLASFSYEAVMFYSEKALAQLYPGENIKSLEVLENGKQDRPIKDFNKYEDIPNNFLANIRMELIKKLSKKDQFHGILDQENNLRKSQGENITDTEGKSPDHLCCLIFVLLHSTDACYSLILTT